MKRPKRKGLSFLELVIAMTLTFLSITFLMGLFVTSLRNGERSKKRSRAALMAQSTLERLSAFTADQIASTHSNFDPPMQDYVYDVDVQPAGDYTGFGNDPDLKQVICTVTDPTGNQSTLVALRQAATPLYGLAVSRLTDNLVFSQDPIKYGVSSSRPMPVSCVNTTEPDVVNGNNPYLLNWYPNTNFLVSAGNPTMPGNGQVGAICSNPDLTGFCAVDLTNRGIRFISSVSPSWGTLAKPTGLGHPSGVTGIVDAGGNSRIFLGDDKNRCIWQYKQSSNTWIGPLAAPGMGRVASMACDDALQTLWVIDINAKGLRCYDVASGTWSATVKTPGPAWPAVGNLVGLAVSGDGKRVFTCDEQNLFILDPISNTWTVPPSVMSNGQMPSKLTSDIPQALATNTDGSKLWASPAYGSLYYYDVTNDTWIENYIP